MAFFEQQTLSRDFVESVFHFNAYCPGEVHTYLAAEQDPSATLCLQVVDITQVRLCEGAAPCFYVAVSDSQQVMWATAAAESEAARVIDDRVEIGTVITVNYFGVLPSPRGNVLLLLDIQIDGIDTTCGLIGEPRPLPGVVLTEDNLLDRERRAAEAEHLRASGGSGKKGDAGGRAHGKNHIPPHVRSVGSLTIAEAVALECGLRVAGVNLPLAQGDNDGDNDGAAPSSSSAARAQPAPPPFEGPVNINEDVIWSFTGRCEWISKMRRGGGGGSSGNATALAQPAEETAEAVAEANECVAGLVGGAANASSSTHTNTAAAAKRLVFDARLVDVTGCSINVVFAAPQVKHWASTLRVGQWVTLFNPRVEKMFCRLPSNDAARRQLNSARRREEVRARFGNVAGPDGHFLLIAEQRFGDPLGSICRPHEAAEADVMLEAARAQLQRQQDAFRERRQQQQRGRASSSRATSLSRASGGGGGGGGAFDDELMMPLCKDYSSTKSAFLSVRHASQEMERLVNGLHMQHEQQQQQQHPLFGDAAADDVPETGRAGFAPSMIGCVYGIVRHVTDLVMMPMRGRPNQQCARRTVTIADTVTPSLVACVTLWDRLAQQISPAARGAVFGFRDVQFNPAQHWDLMRLRQSGSGGGDLGKNVLCVMSVGTRSFSECVTMPDREDAAAPAVNSAAAVGTVLTAATQQQQFGGLGGGASASCLPSMQPNGVPLPLAQATGFDPVERIFSLHQYDVDVRRALKKQSRMLAAAAAAGAAAASSGNLAAASHPEHVYLCCRVSEIFHPLHTWCCSSCSERVERLTGAHRQAIDAVVQQAAAQDRRRNAVLMRQQQQQQGNNYDLMMMAGGDEEGDAAAAAMTGADGDDGAGYIDPTRDVAVPARSGACCTRCGGNRFSARFRIAMEIDDGCETRVVVGYQNVAEAIFGNAREAEVQLRALLLHPEETMLMVRGIVRHAEIQLRLHPAPQAVTAVTPAHPHDERNRRFNGAATSVSSPWTVTRASFSGPHNGEYTPAAAFRTMRTRRHATWLRACGVGGEGGSSGGAAVMSLDAEHNAFLAARASSGAQCTDAATAGVMDAADAYEMNSVGPLIDALHEWILRRGEQQQASATARKLL